MLSFHPLKVAAVERIAEDAVCVTLAIPQLLREKFRFDAGQYVTVRRMIDGREERRTYSIVAASGVRCAANRRARAIWRTHVGGTRPTEYEPGDVLEVGTPMGRFRTSVDPARDPILCRIRGRQRHHPDIVARDGHSRPRARAAASR